MEKPTLRTKSITAKMTPAEHGCLQEFANAQGQSLGELARALLLRELQKSGSEETILAEVLALRAILLNVVYGLSRGEVPNSETMRELIARSDADKHKKAREFLGMGAGQGRSKLSSNEVAVKEKS